MQDNTDMDALSRARRGLIVSSVVYAVWLAFLIALAVLRHFGV